MTDAPECLLLSVGGTLAPLRVALETLRPATVVLFCSRESRSRAQTELTLDMPHAFVTLANSGDTQDLDACLSRLLEGVPRAMRDMGLDRAWPDQVDFTGGTKVMSAALVWCALRYACRLHYVGARDSRARDKEGVGRVLDGGEHAIALSGDGIRHRMHLLDAVTALKRGDGPLAMEESRRAVAAAPHAAAKDRAHALRDLAEGVMLQDRFNFKAALNPYGRVLRRRGTASREIRDEVDAWLETAAERVKRCQNLCENRGKPNRALLLELWENAERRMEECRWEDAVARVYALVERILQMRLMEKYGHPAGHFPAENVPENLREDYGRKYADATSPDTLRLGLMAVARLLVALEDECIHENDLHRLGPLLEERNLSILAHGVRPVDGDMAREFRSVAEDLLHRI